MPSGNRQGVALLRFVGSLGLQSRFGLIATITFDENGCRVFVWTNPNLSGFTVCNGNTGKRGEHGINGSNGKSAYEQAVADGSPGSFRQRNQSLKGDKGNNSPVSQHKARKPMTASGVKQVLRPGVSSTARDRKRWFAH